MTVTDMIRKWNEMKNRYPWYNELYDQHGGTTPPQSWNDFPIVDAQTLDRFYYRDEHQGTLTEDERSRSHCFFTSGTSNGERKKITYSAEDEQNYVSAKVSLFRHILSDQNGRISYRKAAADMGTGHAAATATTIFRELGIECLNIPFAEPIEQHIEQLKTYRAEVLYTMPSILEHLLDHVEDPRSLGIREIILVGEICTPEWRRQIASALAIAEKKITDTYGSIEIGTIAYYRHDVGRYVFLDNVYAEITETGQLLLTALQRECFPAVRFDTCDRIRDLRVMTVDGREKQTFAALVGRVGNEFKHGEKISLYDIEDVVYRHIPDARVRVQSIGRVVNIIVRSNLEIADELTQRTLIMAVKRELAERIPEIGVMIRNRLIAEMNVIFDSKHSLFTGHARKSKKWYG